jgi:hypothetical protein
MTPLSADWLRQPARSDWERTLDRPDSPGCVCGVSAVPRPTSAPPSPFSAAATSGSSPGPLSRSIGAHQALMTKRTFVPDLGIATARRTSTPASRYATGIRIRCGLNRSPAARSRVPHVGEASRIRRCISAVRISESWCRIPKRYVIFENSADQVPYRIEPLIWPSMLCIGW